MTTFHRLTALGFALHVAYSHVVAVAVTSNAAAPTARNTAATVATSSSAGVYTEAQAKRGATVYTQKCAKCHLDDLLGDDCASPLTGPSFDARWNGVSLGEMYQVISQGMPVGAPSLSPQEYIDVISYVLSVNKLPAGGTELAPELVKLNTVKLRLPQPQ